MPVDPNTLAGHVNADANDPHLKRALDVARETITTIVGTHPVPTTVVDQAVLECAGTVYAQRNAPFGIAEFADESSAGFRVSRDSTLTARRLLAPWLPGGFA